MSAASGDDEPHHRAHADDIGPQARGYRPPRRIRHIHIEFRELTLDYQATAEQAQNIADLLASRYSELDLRIVVDDTVDAHLPPLPCADLWE
ncbi:hypothetical protein AB0M45_32855 [Nocardia sp. NPDC051787]|uniref:hypothetical protein n=1 Tax=Nocardia sp. NPDC051787 TaxID=3155415 RepID=UPI0034215E10